MGRAISCCPLPSTQELDLRVLPLLLLLSGFQGLGFWGVYRVRGTVTDCIGNWPLCEVSAPKNDIRVFRSPSPLLTKSVESRECENNPGKGTCELVKIYLILGNCLPS